MRKVLILGASGMAGHVIHHYLRQLDYDVTGIARTFPPFFPAAVILDVHNIGALDRFIASKQFDIIVNCIGVLNSAADSNKESAVFINSYLPHWLARFPAKLIHLSTDCVFSGKLGSYPDDAPHDGGTFYDRSKSLGEVLSQKDLTLRQSIIGPELSTKGIGLLNWFLTQKGPINGYTNAIWNGVTTLELAKGIDSAIRQELTGLYQFVPNSSVTKCDLLIEFKRVFAMSDVEILPFENQPRIDKTLVSIRNDFEYSISPYSTQLNELKQWMVANSQLYQHYDQIRLLEK